MLENILLYALAYINRVKINTGNQILILKINAKHEVLKPTGLSHKLIISTLFSVHTGTMNLLCRQNNPFDSILILI